MKDFKSMAGSLIQNKRVAVPAVIAALLLLVLILLPLGMSWGLNRWLLANGGEVVSIEDVDVNLFTGKVSIEQLQLEADGHHHLKIPRLELDIEWLPLFSQHVVIKSVLVDGVEIGIAVQADGSMTIGGVVLPDAGSDEGEASPSPWGVGLEQLQITNSSVSYQSPDLRVDARLDKLLLLGLKTWVSEPAPLTFEGAVNGARISLDGHLPALSDAYGYAGKLAVDALPLRAFASLAESAVRGLEGQLSVDTQLDIRLVPGNPPEITQQGMIRTDAIKFQYDEFEIAYSSLGWEGQTRFAPASGEGGVQVNGALKIAGLGADANVADIKIVLANIGAVEVADIALGDNGDLSVSGLTLSDVVFARNVKEQDGGSVLSAGAIVMDRIQITAGNQIEIGTMDWRDTVSVVRREADGVWRPVRIVNTLPFANREADKAEPDPQEPAGRISVDLITVTGNSAMILIDETVKPEFSARIDLTEAHLRDIDNSKPEQHSPVTVKGRIGKHSRIDVGGTMQPFAPEPGVDLKLQLEGIALTEISPYMVDALGYALESGHLDADSTLKLNKGQLDASNKLTIRELALSPAGNDSQAAFDAKLPVPLDSALNMLRDKHNTIALDLPVSGDMESPDFDVSDVINTAVSKAIKQGSLTYLTMALQPYGTLITIARIAGEQATKVRLQPVVFEPGLAVNMEDSYGYLEKVAGILKDRPEVNVRICGLAVEEDRPALGMQSAGKEKAASGKGEKAADAVVSDQQLLDLARQRAAAVKDHLVAEHAVSASRLVACQPHIDDEGDDGAPRVDLLI
jgi:hypothetical protein